MLSGIASRSEASRKWERVCQGGGGKLFVVKAGAGAGAGTNVDFVLYVLVVGFFLAVGFVILIAGITNVLC